MSALRAGGGGRAPRQAFPSPPPLPPPPLHHSRNASLLPACPRVVPNQSACALPLPSPHPPGEFQSAGGTETASPKQFMHARGARRRGLSPAPVLLCSGGARPRGLVPPRAVQYPSALRLLFPLRDSLCRRGGRLGQPSSLNGLGDDGEQLSLPLSSFSVFE